MTGDSEEQEEWKYGVDEVGDSAEADANATEEAEPEERDRRIEPGTPNLENAVFVALGALLALGVIARGLGFI